MQEFIAVDTARSIIVDAMPAQPVEARPLNDTQGWTLAETVRSPEAIPQFDSSAMDGYAVRTDDLGDLPATLRIASEIPAGVMPDRPVEAGACAQIMTGAPVPEGADAIAPVEWTERIGEDAVRIERAPEPGQYVRPAGKDVREGEVVAEAGQVITPPVVGMLAKLGVAEVPVRVPPTVAVIATGDELVDIDETPGPGQIRNSNAPALAAQVRAAGGVCHAQLRARDNKEDIRRVIEEALAADVLVFSGGVSVGEYDLVKDVLDEMGMTLAFWKVRQRPGKPLAFGMLRSTPVFGLPGNPVSSAMCFEQHVRPALAKMLGRRELMRPRHPAVLAAETTKVEGLHFFARGIASFGEDGRLQVRDTGPQASNLYSSVVKANCIVHLPEDLAEAPAGTPVEIEWLDWTC